MSSSQSISSSSLFDVSVADVISLQSAQSPKDHIQVLQYHVTLDTVNVIVLSEDTSAISPSLVMLTD